LTEFQPRPLTPQPSAFKRNALIPAGQSSLLARDIAAVSGIRK
jgi:hypothetical protein